MFNAMLQKLLHANNTVDSVQSVYVYVEGGLYYPIETVRRDKEGNYIIVCRDIAKVESE